VTQKE